MGVILNGILGGVSGKVGGVVGSNWKGIDTLRAYAIPANPQTPAQVAQRDKFTGIVAFLRLILLTILQPYWDPFAVQQSGFNVAMSRNLLSWTDETDFDSAIVAEGNLESAPVTSALYNVVNGDFTFNWVDTITGNGLGTDSVAILCVDTVNNISFYRDVDIREDAQGIISIGADRAVADLKAYIFCFRGSGATLEVSPSLFEQVVAS